MSFATLKKQGSLLDKLTKEVDKLNEGGSYIDERIWKPQMDKSGNGYAVIRFLPSRSPEDLPWAQVWSHAFQGPGGWYIENSLTTIGKQDPVGEMNRQLWNSGLDSDKEIARKQKRKLSYYSNIYVISDPANPDNEGKIFIYKYGKKIHDKICEAMKPSFADEEAIDPFNFWEGADFKLKITKVAGYWNYDKSEFARPATLGNFSDEKLEKIYNQLYDLNEFTAADQFKSYDELQNRFDIVLGKKGTPRVDRETYETEFMEEEMGRSAADLPNLSSSASSSDDEDNFSYFNRLADEDF